MIHHLKTHPDPFSAVLDGNKRHEVRVDDRGFRFGDTVHLHEYVPAGTEDRPPLEGEYTGRSLRFRIGFVTGGGVWGLPRNLCVFTLLEKLDPLA